jgi:deoxyribose-phosphate aldolase
MLKRWSDLPSRIDHTILRPEATRVDVQRLCEEAIRHAFHVVFVPPCYITEAVEALADTYILVGIPVGFPLGGHTTTTKVTEAIEGVKRGAAIVDMVMNISLLKSGDYEAVRKDIAEVIKSTSTVEHKVIVETCYLTEQEKITACRLVVEAGADYVKTSTGFGPGGATVEDVALFRQAVAGRAKVKASGGIRDLAATVAMLEAGADRIGTSAGVKIIEEWSKAQSSSGLQ